MTSEATTGMRRVPLITFTDLAVGVGNDQSTREMSDEELEQVAARARWQADRMMPSDLDALRAVSRESAQRARAERDQLMTSMETEIRRLEQQCARLLAKGLVDADTGLDEGAAALPPQTASRGTRVFSMELPAIDAFPTRRYWIGPSEMSVAFETTWAQLHAHNDYHWRGRDLLCVIASLDVGQTSTMLSGRSIRRLPDCGEASRLGK